MSRSVSAASLASNGSARRPARIILQLACDSLLITHSDAIAVNANPHLSAGRRLTAELFSLAGKQLMEEIAEKKKAGGFTRLLVGELVDTAAHDITCCKHILHVRGPAVKGTHATDEERRQLRAAYQKVFMRAEEMGIKKLAITFLCVETNEFPMKEGIEIAVEEAFTVSRNAAIKSLMHICLHSLDDDVIEMAERKLAELKADEEEEIAARQRSVTAEKETTLRTAEGSEVEMEEGEEMEEVEQLAAIDSLSSRHSGHAVSALNLASSSRDAMSIERSALAVSQANLLSDSLSAMSILEADVTPMSAHEDSRYSSIIGATGATFDLDIHNKELLPCSSNPVLDPFTVSLNIWVQPTGSKAVPINLRVPHNTLATEILDKAIKGLIATSYKCSFLSDDFHVPLHGEYVSTAENLVASSMLVIRELEDLVGQSDEEKRVKLQLGSRIIAFAPHTPLGYVFIEFARLIDCTPSSSISFSLHHEGGGLSLNDVSPFCTLQTLGLRSHQRLHAQSAVSERIDLLIDCVFPDPKKFFLATCLLVPVSHDFKCLNSLVASPLAFEMHEARSLCEHKPLVGCSHLIPLSRKSSPSPDCISLLYTDPQMDANELQVHTTHAAFHACKLSADVGFTELSALVPDFSGENDQEEKKKKSCAFIKGLMAGFILRRHMFPDQPMIRRLSIVSEDVSTLESYRIVAGLSSGSPALYLWTPSDSEPLYHHITVDFNKENRLAFMKKVWAAHLLVAQCQRRMEESINAFSDTIDIGTLADNFKEFALHFN